METKKINYEEQECPLCGEYLNFNKEGVMRSKSTTEIIYVFTCEECNQAFALDNDDKIKLIPYDSDMKPIENKCKICGIIKNYNEHGIFLLNVDTAYYEFHCFDCVIPILQSWLDRNSKTKTKVTKKNVHEIYEVYDFNKNNEMLQEIQKNPDKYKETMDKIKIEFETKLKEGGNSSQA